MNTHTSVIVALGLSNLLACNVLPRPGHGLEKSRSTDTREVKQSAENPLCAENTVFELSINVKDETGLPIRGARISAKSDAGDDIEAPPETGKGVYAGTLKKPGIYTLLIEADGYESQALDNVEIKSGSYRNTTQLNVVLARSSQTASGCTEQYIPGVIVKLIDKSGAAITNAEVTASSETHTLKLRQPTPDASFSGVNQAGSYQLTVTAPGFKSQTFKDIVVNPTEDGCHVQTVFKTVTLEAE